MTVPVIAFPEGNVAVRELCGSGEFTRPFAGCACLKKTHDPTQP
jgi:hypothetical protein